jgi:hypothetical protein
MTTCGNAAGDKPSRPARDPRTYDAIHRALLTGLLGNVGMKTGDFEYTGARNTKFHIFPGSGPVPRQAEVGRRRASSSRRRASTPATSPASTRAGSSAWPGTS